MKIFFCRPAFELPQLAGGIRNGGVRFTVGTLAHPHSVVRGDGPSIYEADYLELVA